MIGSMESNKKVVSVTLSPELLQRIDAVCEARGEPRSSLVERVLQDAIKAQEELLKGLESPLLSAAAKLVAKFPGLMELMALVDGETPKDVAEFRKEFDKQAARAGERRALRKRKSLKPEVQS